MVESDTPFISSLAHHAADPFRLLVESVAEYAIFMLDPAGNVASWNTGAVRIFGYSAEEIIGVSGLAFYTPEEIDQGVFAEILRDARVHGAVLRDGLRIRKNGSRFSAEVTTSNLKDYFGNHVGFSVVTRDVTERLAAEAAVRRERDLVSAILDSAPAAFYMYDRAGRFERWNKRFEEVTGYSAEEIGCAHPLDFFHESEREVLRERILRVFEDGFAEVEANFRSKDGHLTPYYFNGVRADFNGEDHLLGMGIDISALKRAEAALRANDERLLLAARAANVGLWDVDLVTNEAFYSSEWKRQLGYRDEEIGNAFEEWESRVHPDDLEAALQRYETFLADPTARYESEFRLRHRDGSYRTILAQASLSFDDAGKPVRMLGAHVDVTSKRALEWRLQQTHKMEAFGQLAAGVAHDFNNLLTVINGYSEVLIDQLPEDSSERPLYVAIHEAGRRASNLTRQLLAFSRQQVMAPVVMDLNAAIRAAEEILRRLAGPTVRFSIALAPDLGRVKADPSQVEQILLNLTVNARDAMPGGGRLTIETANVTLDPAYCRAYPDLRPGDYVQMAVSDTGYGMDEGTAARIFEPFFTTKAVGEGTGLGLATVHGIVKQSGGHITVYSEPGRGTKFKVYLPRISDVALHRVEETLAMPTGSETILLVEDDDSVRTLAAAMLRRCGYTVIEASDGNEALAAAGALGAPPALLLTDVVMPRLGGRELAERFTMRFPGAHVLIMSGYESDAALRHGPIEHRIAFLAKPFTASTLAQKVRALLDERV